LRGEAIRDSEGKITDLWGAAQDITEHKRSEEKLREISERLRLANKATNHVIWDWDVIQDTQQWNEAGTAVFGWTEIVERPVSAHWWVERVHPDDMARVHDSFFAVVNNPEYYVWNDEYRFLRADGTYAIVLDRGYVLRDDKGKAIRMIGAMLDITERKRAEEEIQKQLVEKEILLREVHHRIKNNIASLESLLSLQIRSNINDVKSALQDALTRIQSMRILYDKLLIGKDFQEVSSKNYIESLIDAIVVVFTESEKITFEKRITDFSLNSKIIVPLGIIINELLTNIFKYAFTEMVHCQISINLDKTENHVTLTIQDNGKGIDERVDFTKSPGFGLTIVKILTEQLKGVYSIENDNGTRSVLKFEI